VAVRLTALSEVADLVRLLLAPVTLRVDYSPAERTIVTSALDGRFLVGLLLVVLWVMLVVTAWRRHRRVEALGLVWVAVAYAPVSNLIVPIGLLMGERTLYLASAGAVLALAGTAVRLQVRASALAVGAACVVALGAVRTAVRVPIWHDNLRVALSIVEDSPKSYQGPMASAGIFLEARRPAQALEYADTAVAIFPLHSNLAGCPPPTPCSRSPINTVSPARVSTRRRQRSRSPWGTARSGTPCGLTCAG
jgi:hypothetical protein